MFEIGNRIKAKSLPHKKGFSMIEILVVLVIIGVMAAVLFPAIINSLNKRSFDSTAKQIVSNLMRAKFQAVKTHLNHRVRFIQETEGWSYYIEQEDMSDQWSVVHGFIKTTISTEYNVTVNLPNQEVIFSPLGIVTNFSSSQNSLTIHSPALQNYNQPSNRLIMVYSGGSVKYSKT